eukprot:m.297354 g.297354  ORF g.297354 m.297354 type:complete len:361 (+) comp13595_c0_seq1:20-1102(+)
MGRFVCDKCGDVFPAPFHLKSHQKGGCPGHPVVEERLPELPEYKFDFGAGHPADIAPGVWQTLGIDGAHHSAGGLGSTGVFFLNLKQDGGVIVLKQGSANTASEYFCTEFINTLHLGVTTPRVRILPMKEFHELLDTLKRVPFSVQGAGEALQLDRVRSAGGIFMEFVPGMTLKHPDVHIALKDDKKKTKMLESLAGLCVMDMLLNNFDRTPLIWPHNGNANNILFRLKDNDVTVHAIDQACIAITNQDGIADYLKLVEEAVGEAVRGEIHGAHVTKIRKFFELYTDGFDIGDDGCRAFLDAMAEAARTAVKWDGAMSLWQKTLHIFVEADWNRSAVEQSLDGVRVDFIQQVSRAMAAPL